MRRTSNFINNIILYTYIKYYLKALNKISDRSLQFKLVYN